MLLGLGLLEMPEAHLARILLHTNGDGNDGSQINDLRKEKDQVPNLAAWLRKRIEAPPPSVSIHADSGRTVFFD